MFGGLFDKKDEPKEQKAKGKNNELLVRIRQRYKIMADADSSNRIKALEDLRFANVPGAQWDTNMRKNRGDRPCYEFNKVRVNGKKVINEIRANRPRGKVRAVENGDSETADLIEGLCRNIANISDFDTITDNAAEYQVDAGMGAWRVVTEYSSDTAFDQDILIKGIKNPLCLYADPACQDIMKRDAEDWVLTERISKTSYATKYKNAAPVNFEDSDFDDDDEWEDVESVRIVEYWYKEPYDKEIWLVQTPTGTLTVDSTSDEAPGVQQQIAAGAYQLVRKRVAKCHKVMMCIASGDAVLEGPVEWAGSQFPFVMVYGEYKVIDGEAMWWGLHRFAKDPQRSYNISRTAIDETIALAPKAKFWATAKQAVGNLAQWAEAHMKNLPFQIYNHDPEEPGEPKYMPGAQVPVALMQQSIVAAQDIRDTTGLHETSFGEESNEKSGVAIQRKQNQAQVVTYNFQDNMAKGVRRTWEILIDLIPEIYDAERELRIIGTDEEEDYKTVNQIVMGEDGQPVRVNDMSAGKYDVVVTVGPNYATQRQEAVEVYSQLFPPDSPVYPFIADLIAKSFDSPFADEMAKRLVLAAPPQVQKMLSEGKDQPPEVAAALAQVEQAKQLMQQQMQLVQNAAQELNQEKADNEKGKAELDVKLANLKAAEANLEAKFIKLQAQLQGQEQQLGSKEQELGFKEQALGFKEQQVQGQQDQVESATGELSEAQKAVQEIDQAAAQFMQQAAAVLKEMHGMLTEAKSKPRVKSIRMERKPGQPPRAVPEYEDQNGMGNGSMPMMQ